MSGYLALWRAPGLARVIATQLLARFPFGMMSLAFVMHIQEMHKSYAIAGIALGAETVGAAISGPVLARWLGRLGVRRVLLITAAIGAICMLLIGTIYTEPVITIVLSGIVGLSSPPIQSAVRTIYPTLVKKKQLPSVYAVDATLQELIWVIGPVLATIIAATSSTAVGVVVMAAIQIIGASLFTANREVGTIKIPESTRKMGGVLKNKIVFTNVILGTLLIGSFAGIEVGSVAILDKSVAGVVLASFSLGSIVGGVALGNRAKTKWALAKFLTVIFVGSCATFINPTDAIWLTICFFVAGIGVAPCLGMLGTIIATNITMGDAAEAYGWINTGQLMGFSIGAALAGIAVDTVAPTAALLIAVVFGFGAILVAIMAVNITPVPGKPIADTQNIKIIKQPEEI